MRLPTVTFQVRVYGSGFTSDLCPRNAFEWNVKTAVVVIILERFKLSLQVKRLPDQRLIKKHTANGSDEALYEGMRA